MKTKLKIKILESCVLSVLTYGAQTWSLTKTNRLLLASNKILYKICSLKYLVGCTITEKIEKYQKAEIILLSTFLVTFLPCHNAGLIW